MQYLEREFRDILNKYGHYALHCHYRRGLPEDKLSCPVCKNEITNTYEDACLNCFGTGKPMTVSKILVREEDSNITSSLSNISKFQAFGELAVPGRYYFMNKDINIKEHDLILDVDWNGNHPVYTFRRLSEVTHVDIKRFENGEPIFQKVYVSTDPVNRDVRAHSIISRYNKDYLNI